MHRISDDASMGGKGEGLASNAQDTDLSEPVRGVKDEDLSAIIGELVASPSSERDDADRFMREVRAIAEKRAQASWPNETAEDVAVFVLARYPRQIGKKFGGTPILDLIANDAPLLGKVFFLSRDASSGRCIEFPTANRAEILDWLEDNGFENSTIVIVYRTQKMMVARRDGVKGDARKDDIRDIAPSASVPQLLDALEYFHRKKLLIPSLCPRGVWESGRASQYVPGASPEKAIQSELQTALNFWFRGVVRAEIEDVTDIGRVDVRLLRSQSGGPLYYWAIVELKVIKSLHNAPKGKNPSKVRNGENVEAVVKGVRQAHAYRENRQAEEGLLEVYDMRREKKPVIFDEVDVQDAIKKHTSCTARHCREIFGEAEHARKAGW